MNSRYVSRFTIGDLVSEVWLDLRAKPSRTILTMLGTLIGVAVLVSTVGLAASLNAQIWERFEALVADEITVTATASGPSQQVIPADAPNRAKRINGVLAAATLTELPAGIHIDGTPGYDPTALQTDTFSVYAASTGLAVVTGAELRGVFISEWHDTTGQAAAVLGAGAAQRLGITSPVNQPVIFINDRPVTVIGIIHQTEQQSGLLQAVIVSETYAKQQLGHVGPQALLVKTVTGGGPVIAKQIAVALRPDNPDMLAVNVPPSPELTRQQVSGDLTTLLIGLAIISLIIGGIGIANTTLVSVLERVPEIGLRRALGARRQHIMIHFLALSTIIGLAGAIIGTEAGILVTLFVSLAQQWPPTMPLAFVALAPLIGAVVGLLAGTYPAHKAAKTQPIQALRA